MTNQSRTGRSCLPPHRPLPATSPAAVRAFRVPVLLAVLLASPGGHLPGQVPQEAPRLSPPAQVEAFLDRSSGFQLLGPIRQMVLASQEPQDFSLPLVEGARYMVVAYCDGGCSNLDLVLLDPDGSEIYADRLPDNQPLLAFTAEAFGYHQVQVFGGTCPEAGCQVAVGVLARTDEEGVPPGEDMGGRYRAIRAEMVTLGFADAGEERRGGLPMNQAVRVPLPLSKGQPVRIVGLCDQDCWDLDLTLYHPSGMELDRDYLEDALPILALVPDTTADFALEVIMVGCEVEPCEFRIHTFAKSPGADSGSTALVTGGDVVSLHTHNGELGPDDDALAGAYYDVYEIEVEAGRRLVVDLRSQAFDTVLRAFDPNRQGQENDDVGMDTGHSRLELMALHGGTYTIHVTSFQPEVTGQYTLQIAVVR